MDVELPLAALIEKSTPDAVREIVWGESAALSVNCRLPLALPTEEAEKVTFKIQDALTVRLAPQLFVSEKLPLEL